MGGEEGRNKFGRRSTKQKSRRIDHIGRFSGFSWPYGGISIGSRKNQRIIGGNGTNKNRGTGRQRSHNGYVCRMKRMENKIHKN